MSLSVPKIKFSELLKEPPPTPYLQADVSIDEFVKQYTENSSNIEDFEIIAVSNLSGKPRVRITYKVPVMQNSS